MDSAHETPAWKEWFEAHGPRLLLCARQWCRSLADAEDVLQDAFVRYWRRQRHLPGEPGALLVTSIRRAALDRSRRDARRSGREERAGGPESDGPLFEAEAGEADGRRAGLERAIGLLAPEQREVLVLRVWEDLTFEEIGRVLRLSPNTAASRYRYALNALRKQLEPVCHE